MHSGPVSQNRRSGRSKVLLSATLETRRGTIPVKLRNLSAEGALVQGDKLPIEGTELLFRRNDLGAKGRIVWVDGRHAGVAFDDRLAPEQVLRHVPSPRPKIKPEFRRPGLGCRELTPEERRLLESWVWSSVPAHPAD